MNEKTEKAKNDGYFMPDAEVLIKPESFRIRHGLF